MPSLSPLILSRLATPSTLREAVTDQLREAIVVGDLAPGTLLRETELALRLGVSATPVREAFVNLAAEGLVEVETHRLKRVTPIHLPATLDLLRVQSALWRMGYIWAFAKIGAREIDDLEAALALYRKALDASDPLGMIRAGHMFHTVFISASGNSELLRVTLDRRSLIARFILLRGGNTLSKAGLCHHRAIFEAFKHGDTDGVLVRLDHLAAKMMAPAEPPNEPNQV